MQGNWIPFLVREDLWRREWLLTPVLLPGEFHDRGAWWAILMFWKNMYGRYCYVTLMATEQKNSYKSMYIGVHNFPFCLSVPV